MPGYDEYDYNRFWDYGGDMPGSEGSDLMYGSDIEPYYEPTYGGDVGAWGNVDRPINWDDYGGYHPETFMYEGEPTYGGDVGAFGSADEPTDWTQYGGYDSGQINPEAELAARGGYTAPGESSAGGFSWDSSKSLVENLAAQAAGRFKQNPLEALVGIGSFGAGLYSDMQRNKQLEEQAKQIREAKEKREAKLAKYGAVLPLKLERQLLPQGDLLTAGQRGGGLNWFTPSKFVPMQQGGEVPQQSGWLDRIMSAIGSRRPDPALVGAGGAANAGNAIMQQQYQRYAVGRQMEGEEPLPYEVWAAGRQQGRAHGGLTYAHGGGQDDIIDIKAAPGEYVVDASSVAALGDGNNAEGVRKLDDMIKRLRQHNRSAPSDKIPPRAKSLESYMRDGK